MIFTGLAGQVWACAKARNAERRRGEREADHEFHGCCLLIVDVRRSGRPSAFFAAATPIFT